MRGQALEIPMPRHLADVTVSHSFNIAIQTSEETFQSGKSKTLMAECSWVWLMFWVKSFLHCAILYLTHRCLFKSWWSKDIVCLSAEKDFSNLLKKVGVNANI